MSSTELASESASGAQAVTIRQYWLMRIVSLLPSATEIVYLLGLEADLVGVTHECDWPSSARDKRLVSHSSLQKDAAPAEIDRLVSRSMDGGEPTYRLDRAAIEELAPDIVLTQNLCAVCAVPAGHVQEALDILGCQAEIVSLDPSSLGEVLDGITEIGRATGSEARAGELVAGLHERLSTVQHAVSGLKRPRTFALEWSDPPFNGGHWVPEMTEIAGGAPVLGSGGTPSIRVTWDEIRVAAPEVVVFMPCGYDLDAAAKEGAQLLERAELGTAAVFAVDASGYFSRPGPRLVDGVEILASALHPGAIDDHHERSILRLR